LKAEEMNLAARRVKFVHQCSRS